MELPLKTTRTIMGKERNGYLRTNQGSYVTWGSPTFREE